MKSFRIGGAIVVLAILTGFLDRDHGAAVAADAKAAKKDIRKLQVKLPENWKDDGTVFDERRFIKGSMILFCALSKEKVPATPEELADMAKKNEDLFPGRKWVKTTGIGKLKDGVFVVGICKVMGGEYNAVGAARTIDGVTVMFMASPADDAASRKEFLEVLRSAHFADK
jgi:hypothetical protein